MAWGRGVVWLFVATVSGGVWSTPLVATNEAHQIASEMSRLGPRPYGSEAHGRAADFLLGEMRRVGLTDVRVEESRDARNLSGLLPGRSEFEVVLSAHYDSVAGSPGAGDDASGCGVVLAAIAELSQVPLGHSVRVLLFDREEDALAGSRAWIEDRSDAERDRILADLTVEMVGWSGTAGPVVHLFAVDQEGRRRVPPGWLVHAVLTAGRAVDWPIVAADPTISLLGQLAMRTTRLRHYADSDALQARGVPAVLLSDSSLVAFDPAYHSPHDIAERLDAERLAGWTELVAATVRRLDALPGRPRDDDQYLAVGQRLLHRRQLLWIGFLLWAALVFQGIPGRWKRADAPTRHARGRSYFARLWFRMGFLLATFLAPPLTAVLLFPAGVVALLLPLLVRSRIGRTAAIVIAWLPICALSIVLAAAWSRGFVASLAVDPAGGLLVLASLVAFSLQLRRSDPSGSPGRIAEV